MNLDEAPAPRCTICPAALYADEIGRYACRRCTERVDRQLLELAGPRGLYARLGTRLAPGSGGDGPAVSGSRNAPVPVRLDVLNLMTAGGPVLGPLETWVRDWEARGRAEMCEAGTLQQRVNHAVGTLRFNLEWSATNHAAFDEFAREVYLMHRQASVHVAGERPPRAIPVTCPCGAILRVTVNTPSVSCYRCQTQYGHAEVLRLPVAERRAAA